MADQAASIFGTQTPESQPPAGNGSPANTQNNDPLATLLGSIKNERGEPKYKSLEDALNALKHSQEYIPTLKQTKDELEQKLNDLMPQVNKVAELERVVQELTQRKPAESVTPTQAGLNEEQVAELVSRTLTRQQQQAVQQTNVQSVANTVKARFGDQSEAVFYGKAKELGMSNDEFNALAARTPKAVLKLLGIDDTAAPARQPFTPTRVNTEGFTPAVDSYIGRNKNRAMTGATTQDLNQESANAARMVEELAAQGMSINDLTNPKNYNKFFARK